MTNKHVWLVGFLISILVLLMSIDFQTFTGASGNGWSLGLRLEPAYFLFILPTLLLIGVLMQVLHLKKR